MRFEFATAGRVIFGAGAVREVGPLAAGLGRRALIVCGRTPGRALPLIDLLNAAGVGAGVFEVHGEPTVERAVAGARIARAGGADLIVAMGGGSALDAGKAIAALLTNPGDPLDYLEVVGRGQPLVAAPAPCIAIPTTAGTGAEVTRNAVLGVPEQRVKVSLRSPLMLPRVALVDPELTHGLPPRITAYTGIDALAQAIAAVIVKVATPVGDGIALESVRLAAEALPRVVADGSDAAARSRMACASLMAGLAMNISDCGSEHSLGQALGGRYGLPHGLTIGLVLAESMDRDRRFVPERFERVADALGAPEDGSKDGSRAVRAVRDILRRLEFETLASVGVQEEDLAELSAGALADNFMAVAPEPWSEAEAEAAYRSALALGDRR